MADVKAEASHALETHGRAIDELHQKLAAVEGCDKARLAQAVEKVKGALKTFHDDALGCVGF
ncbi:MAG: hypothetical protein WA814_04925 [Candidatus Baltobacteraceae bacterium]